MDDWHRNYREVRQSGAAFAVEWPIGISARVSQQPRKFLRHCPVLRSTSGWSLRLRLL